MAEHLFVFIQMEFPCELGPADGRYLLRAGEDGDPQRVVVLGTLGAGRMALGSPGRVPRRGPSLPARLAARRTRPATPDPAPVPTTRATLIDPISVSAEHQARAWLDDLDPSRDVLEATAVLNRVLHAHRVASADPYTSEVTPGQALVIRAGWGEGEQVADGRWTHALELPWREPGPGRGKGRGRGGGARSAVLRPQERLAALLGGRGGELLCEELALRARLDLDQGRLAHAAIGLDAALRAALGELREERRQDLALRIAELEQLGGPVAEAAAAVRSAAGPTPEEDLLEHALGRLEAALRARTAVGLP